MCCSKGKQNRGELPRLFASSSNASTSTSQNKNKNSPAALSAPLAKEPAAAPLVPAAVPLPDPPPTFIRVSNGEFVDADCRSIPRISGYNSFMLLEAGANRCCGGRAAVDAQFDAAARAGLTYVRFFAFAVLDSAGLQRAPGKYDEDLLVSFF